MEKEAGVRAGFFFSNVHVLVSVRPFVPERFVETSRGVSRIMDGKCTRKGRLDFACTPSVHSVLFFVGTAARDRSYRIPSGGSQKKAFVPARRVTMLWRRTEPSVAVSVRNP